MTSFGEAACAASFIFAEDSAKKAAQKEVFVDRPVKAALYAAVLPGLGQAYNKSYWKVPIVWVAGAAAGYNVYFNHRNYSSLRKALVARVDDDPWTVDVEYAHLSSTNDAAISSRSQFYKKNRDRGVFICVIWYGLSIAEAIVGAHMKDFDMTDDLGLQLKPDSQTLFGGQTTVPSITLSYPLKKRGRP